MQKNIPQLRFPEFSDEWKQKKYGEIFSFRTTNSYSRENLNYDEGKVKNIHYGDIHTKFPTLFDITKELVPFVNSDIELKRIAEDNYCKEGDLIIADASEDYEDVGKCIEIVNLNGEKVLAGLHTILARPDLFKMATGFNVYLMKSESIRLQIKTIAQGSKVLSISSKRLAEINLDVPETGEQKCIATFFAVLDKKISELNKKKLLLEQYRNDAMQKIFSQELRFKDDGKDFPKWEKKKLSEVAIKKSSNIAANKIEKNFGDYIIYGASGVLKKVDFYEEENDYISIVKDGAGVGRIFYCAGKSSVLGTMEIIKPKIELNTYFLFCLLSNIDFVKYISGSTIPHIYFKDYSNEVCGIPCFKEQTKISNFLFAIDEKINSTQIQIEKTELYKKGLLQKMFC